MNNFYICGEITGGNCPVKGEVPTLSHYIFWYIFLINGTMKTINLTRGLVGMVDDKDYDFSMKWKWYAMKAKRTYYIARTKKINGKNTIIYLHRELMQTPKGIMTDHRDRNGLNCQRYNLRDCTVNENNRNKSACGRSKYLGVSFDEDYPFAQIMINGKRKYLGEFKTEELAAHAYDEAAKRYFGEFANLNFKDESIISC